MDTMTILVDEAGAPGTAHGKPPVNERGTNADCPECGESVSLAYGLGGGPGIGFYSWCDCGWSWKQEDPTPDTDR